MEEFQTELGTAGEVNEALTELAEALEGEANDLSIAVERLRDETDPNEDGEIKLPFYEEEREMVFSVGLAVGSFLESKERAIKDNSESEELSEEEAIEELGGGASMVEMRK